MRAFVAALCACALLTACKEKRDVRNDAGADAAAVRTAPGGPGMDGGALASDAGTNAAANAADAGPPDDSLPPAGASDLTLRGKHLLEAIAQDNPELATDFLFPRDAFTQARDIATPEKTWDKRTQTVFHKDVHTFHKRLKGKDAQFVSIEVGQGITRIVPKRKDFKKPLWRVKHSKIQFTVDGKPQRLEIAEMVSWRGAWYITKLR